jgi:hypothetical protein
MVELWYERYRLDIFQTEEIRKYGITPTNSYIIISNIVTSACCLTSLVCDKRVTTGNFRRKVWRFLNCSNFLRVQRRHNCSPAASFANCVKSAAANVSFYTDNSKMTNFDLWHCCSKWSDIMLIIIIILIIIRIIIIIFINCNWAVTGWQWLVHNFTNKNLSI